MKFDRNPRINASEISQHEFCSIAWYLQRCGYKPESKFLNNGAIAHETMGRKISSMNTYQNVARKALIIGVVLLCVFVLLTAWLYL